MPKAIGIQLAGEQPTAEERHALELHAQTELGEYRLRLIVAFDPVKKKRIVRLDAIQLFNYGELPEL
jgi:hypothetical protein